MLTNKELKKKALSYPVVRAAYDSLEDEFALLDELLRRAIKQA